MHKKESEQEKNVVITTETNNKQKARWLKGL